MKNYFNVIQRHIGKRAIYNYTAQRKRNTGIIANTKRLNNKNWGKVPIGVHYQN